MQEAIVDDQLCPAKFKSGDTGKSAKLHKIGCFGAQIQTEEAKFKTKDQNWAWVISLACVVRTRSKAAHSSFKAISAVSASLWVVLSHHPETPKFLQWNSTISLGCLSQVQIITAAALTMASKCPISSNKHVTVSPSCQFGVHCIDCHEQTGHFMGCPLSKLAASHCGACSAPLLFQDTWNRDKCIMGQQRKIAGTIRHRATNCPTHNGPQTGTATPIGNCQENKHGSAVKQNFKCSDQFQTEQNQKRGINGTMWPHDVTSVQSGNKFVCPDTKCSSKRDSCVANHWNCSNATALGTIGNSPWVSDLMVHPARHQIHKHCTDQKLCWAWELLGSVASSFFLTNLVVLTMVSCAHLWHMGLSLWASQIVDDELNVDFWTSCHCQFSGVSFEDFSEIVKFLTWHCNCCSGPIVVQRAGGHLQCKLCLKTIQQLKQQHLCGSMIQSDHIKRLPMLKTDNTHGRTKRSASRQNLSLPLMMHTERCQSNHQKDPQTNWTTTIEWPSQNQQEGETDELHSNGQSMLWSNVIHNIIKNGIAKVNLLWSGSALSQQISIHQPLSFQCASRKLTNVVVNEDWTLNFHPQTAVRMRKQSWCMMLWQCMQELSCSMKVKCNITGKTNVENTQQHFPDSKYNCNLMFLNACQQFQMFWLMCHAPCIKISKEIMPCQVDQPCQFDQNICSKKIFHVCHTQNCIFKLPNLTINLQWTLTTKIYFASRQHPKFHTHAKQTIRPRHLSMSQSMAKESAQEEKLLMMLTCAMFALLMTNR